MDGTHAGSDEREDRIAVDRPLLIVGAPRSGTTWLHRLLLADDRFCGGQESHFFVSFAGAVRDFDRKLDMQRPHGLACAWTRTELLDQIRALWRRTMQPPIKARPDAVRLVEKTPDHALHLDVIAEVLPQARIIHLVRDSRAVTASLLAAHRDGWGRSWSTGNARVAAGIWKRFVEAAESSAAAFPSQQYLRLHFEHLREDPVKTLERVMSFAEIDAPTKGIEQSVRTVAEATSERPDENGYVLAGELRDRTVQEPTGFVRSGSIGGWRSELGWRQARTVWSETGMLMRRLGYHRDGSLDETAVS
jgi:LPS sulfotransferase NodH